MRAAGEHSLIASPVSEPMALDDGFTAGGRPAPAIAIDLGAGDVLAAVDTGLVLGAGDRLGLVEAAADALVPE